MNVFQLREALTSEYADFVRSFVMIRDERLRALVDEELHEGLLWPDPMIQLNPHFEAGGYVDELVEEGLLHPECARIFRLDKGDPERERPLRFHKHQTDAIRAAATDASYVLTTGTGSGKSLAYIVPIVDRVLKEGRRKGIRAIVVYPMNALANSQFGELEKFLSVGYPDGRGPVTFARYTGQEREEQRQRIKENPPDILLTNYVMLDLLLTRQWDKQIVRAAKGMQFLVLDELHTYRGRQGADVALLVRRVREATGAKSLQCVGTSATLAGASTAEAQQREISALAELVFGTPVEPTTVILETLRRVTEPTDLTEDGFRAALAARVAEPGPPRPREFNEFLTDPLARWIEGAAGLVPEPATGRLVRAAPRAVKGANGLATELAEVTGQPSDLCVAAVERILLEGYDVEHPEIGRPTFAFRLHQFYSRGETVWATAEPIEERFATVHEQRLMPGDRSKVLLPLAFCRACGQEYYVVTLRRGPERGEVVERDLFRQTVEEGEHAGFLYISDERPWPEEHAKALERLPDEWLEMSKGGEKRVKSSFRHLVPRLITVSADAGEGESGTRFAFLPSPFRFCLMCDVSYPGRGSDPWRLSTLGAGGRASATTILATAALRALRADGSLPDRARKLLSFTDNRQDASLQAGHFNDFVQVGLLRSALLRAAEVAGDEGLAYDKLASKVFDALAFTERSYSANPEERFAQREEADRAMRAVIAYRLYRDQKRGWRVTAPNLEQCGLLRFSYRSLEEASAAEDLWQEHAILRDATAAQRAEAARVLLDLLRHNLAIKTDCLRPEWQESLRQRSSTHLVPPWSLDEDETLERGSVAFPTPRPPHGSEPGSTYVSPYGLFGRWLRRYFATLNRVDDTEVVIRNIFSALHAAGILHVVGDGGYQIPDSAMRWIAADGSNPSFDPLRTANAPEERRTNRYFIDFYRTVASDGLGLEGREHTAQVKAEEREKREAAFREGKLPALFCSPTMELGVDISDLNVVNMHNVPPTPANYAQRSGRAGRSGQPALVFTYCTTGSSHDQYYFRYPHRMVSGQVSTPSIELVNEDLVRAHCHAVWIAETGVDLKSSMRDVLDLASDDPPLTLLPSVQEDMRRADARGRALVRCRALIASIPGIAEADWYHDGWVEHVLDSAPRAFEEATTRWRDLYRAALAAIERQTRVIKDATKSKMEKDRAQRLFAQARSQIDLLLAEESETRRSQSDFYTYRYFASEGFLPGYAFPRLPLSAFVPGRRGAKGTDEFLQRPRFLAIAEFGPRALVYHEGSRYIIERVILPAARTEQDRLVLGQMKQCGACGYLHPVEDGPGADCCVRCGEVLGELVFDRLFRLQNVATRRRDRITSDEEERQRMGFELRTGVRYGIVRGRRQVRAAEVTVAGRELAALEYAPAATIWRVNLGWRRRKNRDEYGFLLDTQTGRWERNPEEEDGSGLPGGSVVERVIPYVEDRRNALLLSFADRPSTEAMASLAAALRRAIQVEFQLEETELAAEPLPTPDQRRLLLLFESAEGGAGVLRQLVADPESLRRVARTALSLCHYDPETGQDLRRAERAREDCEAACYDCLMSYSNQPDHRLLDRAIIKDLLVDLAAATVKASGSDRPHAEHLQALLNVCDSETERRFLRWLDAGGYTLPTGAQELIENTKPDFIYRDDLYAVFIDGDPHRHANVQERDAEATARLMDAGWGVIRIGPREEDWTKAAAEYPSVFGQGNR